MKIEKIKNDFNTYDIKLIDKEKELKIFFAQNYDLYMSASNGKRLNDTDDDFISIDVCKRDEELYSIFDLFYKSIILKNENAIEKLENRKNIVWTSDDGVREAEDSIIIFKYDDYYKLLFFRNNRYDPAINARRKSSRNIDIRFSTSGSRNKEFISCFLDLY